MSPIKLQLSTIDQLILESYKQFLDGLSSYLGNSVEIVLHSLESLDHSAIKVINGLHTGRKEGAPITDLALQMLNKIEKDKSSSSEVYFTTNSKGEPLHSTTIAIKGERDRTIGLVCMNFYLNTPLIDIITQLFPVKQSLKTIANENFSDDIADIITKSVTQERDKILQDTSISLNNKNKEIITSLHKQGIFNLKDSVVKTAEILEISKNTVYLHLRNLS